MIDKWDIDDKKAEAWIVKGKMQIRYHGSIHNIELSTVDLIPKDDYEARLKADMVTILEDLDLQIDESAAYNLEVAKVQRLIRDKIDKMKEDKK